MTAPIVGSDAKTDGAGLDLRRAPLDTIRAAVKKEGGKVKLIGLGTTAPLPQFPGVATIAESGLPGFQFSSWFTVVAPAGTPREIVARLNAEILKALADPSVRDQLRDQGLTVRGSSPEELAAATREQLGRYARLFKEAGIKTD
jgi:tripartite-type tricarboxylate transporter receptor subunit TctC